MHAWCNWTSGTDAEQWSSVESRCIGCATLSVRVDVVQMQCSARIEQMHWLCRWLITNSCRMHTAHLHSSWLLTDHSWWRRRRWWQWLQRLWLQWWWRWWWWFVNAEQGRVEPSDAISPTYSQAVVWEEDQEWSSWCQMFYTEQIYQLKFYPKKRA